jgi:hypothetical protein
MERRVSTKVSCTVWIRGKGRDYFKTLPIDIEGEGWVEGYVLMLKKCTFIKGIA